MHKFEKVLNALGHPTRRAIFEKLRNQSLSVAKLADGLPVSRPAVSQHIKTLASAKLIRIKKQGTRNICEIDPEGIIILRIYLDQFWSEALGNFKLIAEQKNIIKQ